ncbi:unnamed protein product [Adineta ricciae]|uniref:Multidrug and toxin extrusion protein n=1 Tax=Adineta ricciae TaxID=249248 RepID=A0A815MDK7_ADIRI|nr:unnamed protein product [Adineta ricciae]
MKTISNPKFRSDTKQILRLCFPYIFSYVLELLLLPAISNVFMGWIGQQEFNACALGRILYLLFAYSCHFGLTYACDTLLSQAYGGNKRQMDIIIQRAFLLGAFAVMFAWIFLVNIQYFTRFIGKDQQSIQLINRYLLFSIIMVPFEAFSILMQKFVINHGVTWPLLAINSIGNVVNVVAHCLLLFVFKFGVAAPPIAFAFAYLTIGLSCIIYLRLTSLSKETWQSWRRDCLQDWSTYMRLGVPGVIISFLQTLVYGGAILLATVFNKDAITSQNVVFHVDFCIFLITLAFAVSATIVLGRCLGANSYENAIQVKNTIYIIVWIPISLTILCSLLVIYWIPYVFHTPESARSSTRYLLLIVIIFCAFDFYHLSQASILRACGRQYFDAIVSFSSYFFVGIPMGVLFIFVLHLNMAGYWFAIISSLIVTNIVFYIYIRKINWIEQAERAQVNILSKKEAVPERTSLLSDNAMKNELPIWNLLKKKLCVFFLLFLLFVFCLVFRLKYEDVF